MLCIIFSLSALYSIRGQNSHFSADIKHTVSGKPADWKSITHAKYRVVFFMLPYCPMCKSYVQDMNKIASQYKADSIYFVAIVSQKTVQKDELDDFLDNNPIKIPIYTDHSMKITRHYKIDTAPTVAVINDYHEVLYYGSIDNRLEDLGKKRTVITQYYLTDVLQALMNNEPILTPKTKPIGCLVED
ncbi:MAG: redoxin family protein [Cytophagales bacterium]|nr:redoxin family protein [Cytophagales bacterium]